MDTTHATALLLLEPGEDRRRLGAELTELGWAVLCGDTLEQAVETVAARGSCDLVIVELPAVDPERGLEAIRRLIGLAPRTRLVALISAGAVQPAVRAVQLGAVACMEKPVSAASVLARVGPRPSRTQLPSLSWVTWNHLQRVVAACGGNKSEAARILGVTRRGLQLMLQRTPKEREG